MRSRSSAVALVASPGTRSRYSSAAARRPWPPCRRVRVGFSRPAGRRRGARGAAPAAARARRGRRRCAGARARAAGGGGGAGAAGAARLAGQQPGVLRDQVGERGRGLRLPRAQAQHQRALDQRAQRRRRQAARARVGAPLAHRAVHVAGADPDERGRVRQAGRGQAARQRIAQARPLLGAAVGGQRGQRLAPAVQRARLYQACAPRAPRRVIGNHAGRPVRGTRAALADRAFDHASVRALGRPAAPGAALRGPLVPFQQGWGCRRHGGGSRAGAGRARAHPGSHCPGWRRPGACTAAGSAGSTRAARAPTPRRPPRPPPPARPPCGPPARGAPRSLCSTRGRGGAGLRRTPASAALLLAPAHSAFDVRQVRLTLTKVLMLGALRPVVCKLHCAPSPPQVGVRCHSCSRQSRRRDRPAVTRARDAHSAELGTAYQRTARQASSAAP